MVSKEKKLQKKIIQLLQSKGAYVIKSIVTHRAGVPDIIACYDGKFIAIEVKGNSDVSPLQKFNIEKIKNAGGMAIVAYDISEVVDLIDESSYRKKV